MYRYHCSNNKCKSIIAFYIKLRHKNDNSTKSCLFFSFFLTRKNTAMSGLNSWNVTVEALHLASEAYNFCQDQLSKANISLPEFDQVVSVTSSSLGYILTHSPAVFRQLYHLFTQLPLIEYNFVTILLLLISTYTVYCFVLATVRWFYRLFYGFVRFSFFILFAYALVLAFNYITNMPTDSRGQTTRTRNY